MGCSSCFENDISFVYACLLDALREVSVGYTFLSLSSFLHLFNGLLQSVRHFLNNINFVHVEFLVGALCCTERLCTSYKDPALKGTRDNY